LPPTRTTAKQLIHAIKVAFVALLVFFALLHRRFLGMSEGAGHQRLDGVLAVLQHQLQLDGSLSQEVGPHGTIEEPVGNKLADLVGRLIKEFEQLNAGILGSK